MSTDLTFQQQLEALIEWSVLNRSRILAGFLATALCLLAGRSCWQAMKTAGQTPLEGTVSLAGDPIRYGTVTLVTDDNQILYATIGPDGRYRFPNVPRGKLRVAISSPNPQSVFEQARTEAPAQPATRQNGTGTPRTRSEDARTAPEKFGATTVALPIAAKFPGEPSLAAQQRQWRPIPGRYASPATSGLEIDTATTEGIQNLALERADSDAVPKKSVKARSEP